MKNVETMSPVRVTLPASAAAEIGTFKKAVGTILDKLGCPACCSGHDIRFDLQRDVMFRDLSQRAMPRAAATLKAAAPANTIAMGAEAGAQIDNVFSAIDRIAEFTGCGTCCSGHDLRLQFEQNFLLDEKLNVETLAVRFG